MAYKVVGLIDAELASKNIGCHRVLGLEKGDEKMNELMKGYNPSSFLAGFDYGMELAMKIVSNQRQTTAMQVVKCENCNQFDGDVFNEPERGFCDYHNMMVLVDDFCNYGEKVDAEAEATTP